MEQLDIRGGDPSLKARRAADSQLTLALLMNPTDANVMGNVHGGTIMKLVDEAGGICAMRHAGQIVVTVAMDSVTFISPVRVGDLVKLHASVNWVGRTSLEVGVRVEAENVLTGAVTHTNSAFAVYVALGADGKPVPIPPLILETDEERRRWDQAAERQELRLQRDKRHKRA
jgi:uncharacterized protein (TIGR00369 family)